MTDRERIIRTLELLLGQLSLQSMREVTAACEALWREQLNGSASSQDAAQQAWKQTLAKVTDRIMVWDMVHLSQALWPVNRVLVNVEGGLVRSVYADRPEEAHVTVRDLDNINAGDPDPFTEEPELKELMKREKGAW